MKILIFRSNAADALNRIAAVDFKGIEPCVALALGFNQNGHGFTLRNFEGRIGNAGIILIGHIERAGDTFRCCRAIDGNSLRHGID